VDTSLMMKSLKGCAPAVNCYLNPTSLVKAVEYCRHSSSFQHGDVLRASCSYKREGGI
jgi:hypothetical protein